MSSLVQTIAPRLTSIFPSVQAQNSAFGPALTVLPGGVQGTAIGTSDEQEGLYMDAMDGEVWGVLASLAIQTPQEEQPLLVSSLREKVGASHSVDVECAAKRHRCRADPSHGPLCAKAMGVATTC